VGILGAILCRLYACSDHQPQTTKALHLQIINNKTWQVRLANGIDAVLYKQKTGLHFLRKNGRFPSEIRSFSFFFKACSR